MDLKALIRDIPDFPQPGIVFKDIAPLLADPGALGYVTARLTQRYQDEDIAKVVGIESRGFIFGAPLAVTLGAGFVPARKPGKLPFTVIDESYALEYGTNTITMHVDAIIPGERVLIVDDVIATGGTLEATCKLVERLGGEIAEIVTIVELSFLKGREKLNGRQIFTMVEY